MAISLATVASSAICVPLVLAIVKLKRGSGLLEALALRAVPLKTLFQWLGIAAAFILASDALTVALHRPIVPKSVEIVYVSSPAWISWPAVLLCAPLLEELFFRGFLFKGLEGAIRPVTAIFVTAACWPIFHLQYDFYDIGTIFVFGLVLGAARSRTGSIAPTLAMHALINLVGWSEAAVLSHRVVA